MKALKRIFKRLEDVMTAVAFAEVGETETAKAFLKDDSAKGCLRKRVSSRKSMYLKPNHT